MKCTLRRRVDAGVYSSGYPAAAMDTVTSTALRPIVSLLFTPYGRRAHNFGCFIVSMQFLHLQTSSIASSPA
jgi:hypothetical protein